MWLSLTLELWSNKPMISSAKLLQKKIEQLQSALLDREQKITSFALQVATHQTEITTLTQSLKSVTFQRDLYKEQLVAKMRAVCGEIRSASQSCARGFVF